MRPGQQRRQRLFLATVPTMERRRERLREEFRRRVTTQGSLPSEDAALLLLFRLVANADRVAQD